MNNLDKCSSEMLASGEAEKQRELSLAQRCEAIVVNTVLDNPTAKLPPNICVALAYCDFWDSVEAREIARGIDCAMNMGRPTHRMVVKYFMAPQYQDWLFHPLFVDSWLPMDLAELEAARLVKRYANKRLVNIIANAYEAVLDRPEKARVVAVDLVQRLQAVGV